MDALSNTEIDLWQDLEQSGGVDSLLEFIPLTSPWYSRPDHLRPLAELFHRAETEGGIRALSSTPPQHAKTTSMLHWAARWLLYHPTHNVAYVSYESAIAQIKSRECREIAFRAGVHLDENASAAAFWKTKEGGGFLATGVGGRLTGFRVDLMIIDDPHKNRSEAESGVYQNKLMDWARSAAFTRLTPEASVIVNMARWSAGDLIGRLHTETDITWSYVNLPAVIETHDEKGTLIRTALAPHMKSLEFLDKQRKIFGEYDWASLYEGSPRPRGGAMFREPSYYKAMDIKNARFAIACDPAASAKTKADHSAVVVVAAVGDGVDQKVYVVDVWRGQLEIPQLVGKLREIQLKWHAPLYIESVGGFKSVAQMLRSIGAGNSNKKNPLDPLRIVEVTPIGDKFLRALPVSAAWNDGRVMLPSPGPDGKLQPWVQPFLSELQKFTGTGDKQDDQVDALAHAFRAVDRRAIAIERGSKPLAK